MCLEYFKLVIFSVLVSIHSFPENLLDLCPTREISVINANQRYHLNFKPNYEIAIVKSSKLKDVKSTCAIILPEPNLQNSFIKTLIDGAKGQKTLIYIQTYTNRISAKYFANLSLSSNIFIVDVKHNEIAKITEVYKLKRKLMFQHIPLELPTLGLVTRRKDFQGMEIIGTHEPGRMYSIERVRRNSTKYKLVGGIAALWIWDLQTIFNFSLEVLLSDGILNPEKESSGDLRNTFHVIKSGEADFYMKASSVVESRAKYLKPLQPTSYYHLYIFFEQPASNSIRDIVTTPLETSTWILLFLTWMAVISFVKITTYFNNYKAFHLSKDFAFVNQIGIFIVGVNCMKALNITPKSLYLKIVLVVGTISGIILYTAYTAQITSILTVEIVPVKQLLDLIKHGFIFTVFESQAMMELAQHTIQKYELSQEVETVLVEEEASHLLNGRKAFISYPDLFYRSAKYTGFLEPVVCKRISKIKFSESRYKSAYFIPKGSQFTEFFNHGLIKIWENGLSQRYSRMYERLKIYECSPFQRRNPEPIIFTDVGTSFLLIFGGILVSIGILSYEILCSLIHS